ncbi:MAG: protein kinase [Myxococcales bacterium]|nr:protein kinase [Myxococcales bacterium]
MADPSAPTVAVQKTPRLGIGALLGGRFRVEAALGEGGMGAVYRARDEDLDDLVALKVLRPEVAEVPGILERFRREVKLARRVTHPNVARTFDLGVDGEVRFLTMELLQGTPLSRRTRAGGLPDVLRIGAEIARGLVAAHAAGVLHRDLKPDNVMVEASGRVAITDFGIARGLDPDSSRMTQTVGQTLGTPAYMAPEQVEGRPLDGRADVYALGVVLYELITGELPFTGDSVFAMAAARLTQPVPDPREKRPDLPLAVAELVRAAMARRREDRPSAADVGRRLDALRGGRVDRDVQGTEPTPTSARASLSPVSFSVVAPPLVVVRGLDTEDDAPSHARTTRAVEAVADALASTRGVRVLVPGGTPPGPPGFVVEVSVRVASGRARGRVRLLDGRSSEQLWSQRIDAEAQAVLAHEEQLSEAVRGALSARLVDADGRRGPSDPEVRAVYLQASVDYQSFEHPRVKKAVLTLEAEAQRHPSDPFLWSALGAARTRSWLLSGGSDRAALAEAEETCLRALTLDATIGETFEAIGILRLQQGELRASAQAFQEAIARSPLALEGHFYLGRLLCECGHTTEGLRHLDLALRLNPRHPLVHGERMRTLALMGDRAGAEACAARMDFARGQIITHLRLALWWQDLPTIQLLLAEIEKEAATGLSASFVPALPAVLALRDPSVLGPVVVQMRAQISGLGAAPRFRTFMGQILVELLAAAADHDTALAELEVIAELPLVDVLWLDGCPLLAALRKEPRFAAVRALVAARAASMWS